MIKKNSIINNDCFKVFPKIKPKSVDMVLVDLPYGQTNCKWDVEIDLNEMWKQLKLICKENCQFVFFTTTKLGYKIIQSNPNWFRYDLVWEKPSSVGYLSANKMPLRNHEMVYVFNNFNNDDVELTRNKDMRDYAEKVSNFIDKPYSQIKKDFGNRKAEHFINRYKTSQFSLPTEETYNKLIELYKIDKMDGFIKFDDLEFEKKEKIPFSYNPQKTEGKPYKINNKEIKQVENGIYHKHYTQKIIENKTGQRHPKSVLTDIKITDEERKHEMVYVFNHSNNDDVELTRNKDMREYAEKVSNFIDKPYSQIKKDFGNRKAEHFTDNYKTSQFSLPTEETYNELIELYKIDKMDGFIKFDDLEFEKKEKIPFSYNPQKTEGKPYKVKGQKYKNNITDVYGKTQTLGKDNKTGQRHPKSVLTDIKITDEEAPKTTILKENYDKEKLHRTQKPVKLCEWLIKSYSNENDLVLDFCMGSGSSIVACKNTKRNYIGIEMNKDIFKIAKKRIN